MSTLVVVAHPDDEVLGCGGMIAQTDEVVVKFVCEWSQARQSYEDMVNAKNALDYETIQFGALRDQGLDTIFLTKTIGLIEDTIDRFQPHTVYTHWSGDLNRHHRIGSDAASVALSLV